jgi:soluble lytic murein transglycosylase
VIWTLLLSLAAADPGPTDCAAILSLVRADGDGAARVMRGRCWLPDDPAAAEAELAPVRGGVWEDYARPLRARAALALARPADAIARLEGLSLPGAAGYEVRLLRARALLALHRSLDARDDLRLLLESPVADEARLLLAEGAIDRGEREAAVSTLRRLWAVSVVGGWHERAADALTQLGAPVPSAAVLADHPLLTERIAALRKANQLAEATTWLLAMDKADAAAATDAQVARALFDARRYAEAAAAWDTVHGVGDAATGGPDALYDHALAYIRSGQPDAGQALWRRVRALHPTSAQADEASYKAAWLLVDAGQCADALPALDAHLAARPTTAWGESARWFKGRCQWRLGLRAEALATWEGLLARHPDTALAPAVAYWRAVAATDPAAVRSGLQAVLDRWPLSGHAWLAAARLGTRFAAPAGSSAPPAWPADLAGHRAVDRALALAQAGLLQEARDEAQVLVPLATDQPHALPIAALLVFAGDAATARRVVGKWCPTATLPSSRALREACWPRPLDGVVTPTAAAWGLPSGLPWAIALAESRMDPSVTSAAGARGLMQIMPAEGDRLHAAAGLPGAFDADRLYVASYNAALGTTELGLKRRALDGVLQLDSLPAVIASYNAGEEAVRRWLVPGHAADDFAEDIPYTETRRYVRTVLGYLMAWRQIYGDP